MFKSLRWRAASAVLAGVGLMGLLAAPAVAEEKVKEGEQRVIITYKPGQRAAAQAAVRAAGGVWKRDIDGMDAMAAVLPKAAAGGLSKRASVFASVEPDVKRYALSSNAAATGRPYFAGQQVPYGIPMVQADRLQSLSYGAAVRKVCIVDSGIDAAHEDLAGNEMTGEYDSSTGWWYTDENHHGTHVAGIIAALNNRGIGVVGVVPNGKVSLHIVKVFGEEDDWAYSSTLISAVNKCRAAGAHIISMSLGGPDKSRTEELAFGLLALRGVLVVAAAGNDGNDSLSYPASYLGVMSVAAIDENKEPAAFSQFNRKVEIAAPGVNVLSTLPMGTGNAPALTVGATAYDPGTLDGSPRTSASAPLADFGFGGAVDAGMAGKVCLIQRGNDIPFATKVANCEASGGVAAVVFNNRPGPVYGTLGTTVTTIPSVTALATDGAAMLQQLGQVATVSVAASNYGYLDGTSMATPYVSGVAALVWGYFPECTGWQIRAVLDRTAQDLGPRGRDPETGFGLVRAKAAYDRIARRGCNG